MSEQDEEFARIVAGLQEERTQHVWREGERVFVALPQWARALVAEIAAAVAVISEDAQAPVAYEDQLDQAAFAALSTDGIRDGLRAACAAVAASAHRDEITPQEADAWLMVLNHARFAVLAGGSSPESAQDRAEIAMFCAAVQQEMLTALS